MMGKTIDQWHTIFLYATATMTRDYAKKSLSSQRRLGSKLIILILLALGLAITVFPLFVCYHHESSKSFRKELSPSSIAADQVPPSSLISAKLKQPQFGFYTLLPKMELTAPTPVSQPSFTSRTVTSLTHFILQIASLKNITDAERLKSRLSALNFPAYVQTYHSTDDGIEWNQVMVGPYSTLQEAEQAQSQLQARCLLIVYY